jgi:hypothetical protein
MRVSVTAAMRRRSPITHGDEQGFGDMYCVADHGGLPGRQTGMRMDGVASDGCYQKQRSVVDHQCSSVRRSPPARPADWSSLRESLSGVLRRVAIVWHRLSPARRLADVS